MNALYLDIFSGISGDMFIGAMLDLGIDPQRLEQELGKLHLEGYHLHIARRHKASIEGIKFNVHLTHEHGHEHEHTHRHAHGLAPEHPPSHDPVHEHEHVHPDGTRHSHAHSHTQPPGPGHEHEPHSHEHGHVHAGEHSHEHTHGRNFSRIKEIIRGSELSKWVKEKSIAVFHRVAVAEGKIHGMPPEEVHFHEVGAVDSIVDIVGACICLEALGKPRVLSAPVVEGTGWVQCAHGRFPVPTTATLEILGARGIALSQCDEPCELVTPTGAAILAEFAESFGSMQSLAPKKIGYGLGTRDNKSRPNVLRAILAETVETVQPHDWETDSVAVLETNLDDTSPEVLGHFVERAFAAGALDVFQTPIQMKKNRPGTLLTVLCPVGEADGFSAMILRETSAFGVRQSTADRRKLNRQFRAVQTPHGEVTMKIGLLDGKAVQVAPEFESCRKLAEQSGTPLKEIFESARKAFKFSS